MSRRFGGAFFGFAVSIWSPAHANDAISAATVFDPSPIVRFFPIVATASQAVQVMFGGVSPRALSMSFSETWSSGSGHGFGHGENQPAGTVKRSKTKPKSILPIGCEALGSVKSVLGSMAGRCMASL